MRAASPKQCDGAVRLPGQSGPPPGAAKLPSLALCGHRDSATVSATLTTVDADNSQIYLNKLPDTPMLHSTPTTKLTLAWAIFPLPTPLLPYPYISWPSQELCCSQSLTRCYTRFHAHFPRDSRVWGGLCLMRGSGDAALSAISVPPTHERAQSSLRPFPPPSRGGGCDRLGRAPAC